ncbi:LysR substrate-binding domain-containing protein (plasmid) [Tistrella bauzanensis]|uniref:LysR substrate-binding domain-containing protein n=1 Tax=Tistrella bauzanensis TaxID=657419 RepID=UPI00166A858D|nr:LysR substrate-binding domain-containing protein [Tistrella bauzanensis]
MESLSGILAFVQTAEHLSFVAAGRRLGISASAVGKSVAKLENDLGVRLFHRTTRRVSLTEEGAAFHERCRRILDDLRDAEAMLSDRAGTPRGRLRVGLPTIGYRFLMPVIPAFQRRYPDIELDLDFNDRIVDPVEAGLDVVIRSGPLADSSLMSRRLGSFRFVICAAPSYLAACGTPLTPGDLAGHDCLRFRFPTSGKLQTWQFAREVEADPFQGAPTLTCNNMEALLGAALAGLGIAHMPDFLARDGLNNGGLQTILDGFTGEPGQFSALWPSSRHLTPRLRVFVDHLCETLF